MGTIVGTVSVRRFDIGELRRPKRLENGWLQVDGYLTRTGIFTYRNPDGTERRELRLPAEVFNADSMKSFAAVPITNEHPPGLLDATNTREHVRGVISAAPSRDGEHIRAPLTIYDAELIADMESGKSELSCGYACELEFTPGEHEGQRYDAVQRNIRGNHVAVVTKARAGETARVRMDTGDAAQVRSAAIHEKEIPMVKIRINGVEFEVGDQVAQALDKQATDNAAALAAVTGQVTAEATRADAAEGANKVLTAKLDAAEKARADAADPEKQRAAITARVALEKVAEGMKVKHDGMTDVQIKRAVIKAAVNLDVSDAEIEGAYKAALVHADSDRAGIHTQIVPANERADGEGRDAEAARAANKKRSADAWKGPIPGAINRDDVRKK